MSSESERRGLISIELANYRSIAQRTHIPLKPLTLLFGYNSAGKSAILRSLPLLASSATSGTSGPLNLSAECARGATFKDILSQYTDRDAISIGIKWGRGSFSKVEYVVRDLPDQRRQIIEKVSILNDDDVLVARAEWIPQSDASGGDIYDVIIEGDDGESISDTLSFDGLSPQTTSDYATVRGFCTVIRSFMMRFSSKVIWLNALRSPAPRWSTMSGVTDTIAPDGGGMLQTLALAPEEVMADVSTWFEKATGNRVSISWSAMRHRSVFSVIVQPVVNPNVQLDLADTGEGMGQVLPVIGLLCLSKNNQLPDDAVIAIEHPELHMHPDAHTDLANLFCEVASLPPPPVMVVETHSENFLLSVQLAIVERRVSSSDVAVCWIRETPDGAVVETIEFDELGRPLGDKWPPGVFGETADSSRKLFLARREKIAKDVGNTKA